MSFDTVICGKGRLGQLIADTLNKQHVAYSHGRIDPQLGLTHESSPIIGTINTLILCFVPNHVDDKSGWQGLLQGLLKQVKSGTLLIKRILFISSTAVYEEIETGIADKSTPLRGGGVRSQGLLDAEKTISQLSSSSCIFRLTGLVGPGYQKYNPITYSNDKPRHAVDTRAVAQQVGAWFLQNQNGHTIEVLTDGFVYWHGAALNETSDRKAIEALSKQHRLLKPSLICR